MSESNPTEPFRITEEHSVRLGDNAADAQRRNQEYLRQFKSETTLEYHVALAALEEEMDLMRESGGPTPDQLDYVRQRQEKIEFDYQGWHTDFEAFEAEINLRAAGGKKAQAPDQVAPRHAPRAAQVAPRHAPRAAGLGD